MDSEDDGEIALLVAAAEAAEAQAGERKRKVLAADAERKRLSRAASALANDRTPGQRGRPTKRPGSACSDPGTCPLPAGMPAQASPPVATMGAMTPAPRGATSGMPPPFGGIGASPFSPAMPLTRPTIGATAPPSRPGGDATVQRGPMRRPCPALHCRCAGVAGRQGSWFPKGSGTLDAEAVRARVHAGVVGYQMEPRFSV